MREVVRVLLRNSYLGWENDRQLPLEHVWEGEYQYAVDVIGLTKESVTKSQPCVIVVSRQDTIPKIAPR